MSKRFPLYLLLLLALLLPSGWGCAGSDPDPDAPSSPPPSAAPSANRPLSISLDIDGWSAWAYADRTTGKIVGSKNSDPPADTAADMNEVASMIKPWLAADYLRLHPAPGRERERQITAMIRDSDDAAAEEVYKALGADDSVTRMIEVCGMTKTRIFDAWWSLTQVTAQDAARLGLCLADGSAAGPEWTPWLLAEMRQVRGDGAFGIPEGLPVGTNPAFKNGWMVMDDVKWRVNCLAITDDYVLVVLARYAAQLGRSEAQLACAEAGRQVTAWRGD